MRPSTGTHLARARDDNVTDGHLVHGYLDDGVGASHVRDARRALDELRELPPRAAARTVFQPVTTGEHERDDGSCRVLAERERAGHGDESDGVDTDVTVNEGAQHRDQASGTSITATVAAQTHVAGRRSGPASWRSPPDEHGAERGETQGQPGSWLPGLRARSRLRPA